jgi:hypothetical protein
MAVPSGLPVFRSSGLPVFRSSGLPVFRSSGLPVFRIGRRWGSVARAERYGTTRIAIGGVAPSP